jgi:hypothetical protein
MPARPAPAPRFVAIVGLATMVACRAGGVLVPPAQDSGSAADDSRPSVGDSGTIEQLPDAPDPTGAIFDPSVVASIELRMEPASWADIAGDPWAKNWHEASFTWQEERVDGVAVRAFGAGSLVAGKPSLKISFDRLRDGQLWRALDELKLDNSSQDAGFLNERIGTAVMRGMGLPAARTGWANVSVNGEHVGFFVVMESIDDRYVERWFGHDDGPLYSTNEHYYGLGLNPITDDPLLWYEPQSSYGGDGQDLVALTGIIAHGSDEELLAALDLEQFARVSVTRSVMGSMDAFSADGNNFYLFDDHGQWKLLPWDFDADLGYPGYFENALAVDPWRPWATSPWSANCVTHEEYEDPVLTRAVALGVDLQAIIDEALAGPLAWETLSQQVASSAALVRDHVHGDYLGYGPYFDCRQANLRLFLHTRLSGLAGGDVADCPQAADGVLRAGDLAPVGTVGWGTLVVDGTGHWGPGFMVNGQHFCTGIFAHAPSNVSLSVPEGYGSLTGAVGLQDWNRSTVCDTGATFEIRQGGQLLWSSGVVGGYQDAVPFGPLDVQPGVLELTAGDNGSYSCDTTAWLDLELIQG